MSRSQVEISASFLALCAGDSGSVPDVRAGFMPYRLLQLPVHTRDKNMFCRPIKIESFDNQTSKFTRPLGNDLASAESQDCSGDGQNTDPQSMDYPNGLPKWTTLKWTIPKRNISNEYYLKL